MGLTLVDALDTLYIMGLSDEFKRATEWVPLHTVAQSGSRFKNKSCPANGPLNFKFSATCH